MAKLLRLLPLALALALSGAVPAAVSGQALVTVAIEHSTYTVAEGAGTLDIKVTMSGTLSTSVSVGLETISGTAGGFSNDFQSLATTLTFPPNTTEQTVSITIIDDDRVEIPDETFSVALLSSSDTRINVVTTPSVITITDNDTEVEWEGSPGEVLENSSFELCAVVAGVNRQPFVVTITFFDPDDALATGQTVPSSLTFGVGETRKCFTLSTGDVEGYPVFVTFGLTGTNDDDVGIGNGYLSVVVYDPDLPLSTVRLEFGTYQGTEDALTSVEIRAIINHPLDFRASVRVLSSDGTAESGQDYNRVLRTLTFEAGETSSTYTTVSIIDDLVLEAPRETFSVSLERGTERRFRVNQIPSTISIADNDTVDIGLESSTFWVTEVEGATVEVCADEVGRTSIGVPVTVRLSSANPAGAVFDSLTNLPLTFQPGDTRECATVPIGEVAGDAMVDLSLTTRDNRVILTRASATINIRDFGRFDWDPTEDFDTLSATGNSLPQGIWSDGSTMWVADDGSNKIYAYSLSTKQRESSNDFNTLSASGNASPRGMWSDGETIWVADEADGRIYAYDLSTKAHDATKDMETSNADGNTSPKGIWSDGETMWVADDSSDKIYAYNLETKLRDSGKDIDSLSAAGNVDPHGIWFDNFNVWVVEDSGTPPENARIFAYDAETRAQSEREDNDNLIPAGNTAPRGLWSNGGTLWVSDEDEGKIYAYRDVFKNPLPVRRPPVTTQLGRTEEESDEPQPPSPSTVQANCVSEVVDEDGGEIELGDVIADRWAYGCPSVTRGGRLAKYYTFTLPITTAVEVALDSHLDDYLVMRRGGLSGAIVARDDDSGPVNNSLISETFPAGQYTIEATTFYADGVEADFTLTVRAVPRILYDGPVSDVAHEDYAPVGPTMNIKLLPTLPMGTLQITIEDENGFGEGAGPLGGEQTTGGSAGQVLVALPKTAWVEYGETVVEVKQSGSWSTHTRSDEDELLTTEDGEAELSQAMQELVEIVNRTEGMAELVESLSGITLTDTEDWVGPPDEGLLDTVFRQSHANCVSQVAMPWLVSASETTGVRVSVPVSLSDSDYLSVAASFVFSRDRPALAQLHDLLATGVDVPGCEPSDIES